MKQFSVYHVMAPEQKRVIHSGREAVEFALGHYDHSTETRNQRLLAIIGALVEAAAKDDPNAVLSLVGLPYFKVAP